MKKELRLPPLRQPVIGDLPTSDAAFVLTSDDDSRRRKSPSVRRRSRSVVRPVRFPRAVVFRCDDAIFGELLSIASRAGSTYANVLRALIRKEFRRLARSEKKTC